VLLHEDGDAVWLRFDKPGKWRNGELSLHRMSIKKRRWELLRG